jgi:hypothetical protein
VDEEGMADVHVASAACCPDARALERRVGQMSGDVTEEYAGLAIRRENARDIEVRSHDQFRRGVDIFDIREQKQRQEAAMAAVQVHPPAPLRLVATVDVPTGVAGVPRAWEPNGKGPTDSVTLNPTSGTEKHVVQFPKDRGRPCRCECRAVGAG